MRTYRDDMRRLRLGITTKVWALSAVGLSLAKLNHMMAVGWIWATGVPLGMAVVTILVATYVNTDGERDER